MFTTVQEATNTILKHPHRWEVIELPFDESLGYLLAEDIHADRPFPPFDRVMMDGIALRLEDFEAGQRSFSISGVQAAGSPQLALEEKNGCLEVMTGAVLPKGTDVVIRYEDLDISEKKACVKIDALRFFQNIHPEGSDRRIGEMLMMAGQRIAAVDVALFATVGKATVKVKAPPKVGVLSTGDELVDVHAAPAAHQIRKSNVHNLVAALKKQQIEAVAAHLPDEKEAIVAALRKLLDTKDVLLLSGGVSKGKFDYLPECFTALGIKKHFHFVAQRPGKPFWFGIAPNGTKVFAFPGNPVSTFMCYTRYFLPWLRNSYGLEPFPKVYAALDSSFTFKPKLTYFLQARFYFSEKGQFMASPEAGQGSGDLANLADVDGFLELDSEQTVFEKGAVFPALLFRDIFC